MKRLPILVLVLAAFAVPGCDMLMEPQDLEPNIDGRYKGDFQVRAAYYKKILGGYSVEYRNVTGAVEFTIRGKKVITTPQAGEGKTEWDRGNGTVWLDFESITSSNETLCSRWRYSGGITEASGFIKGEGGISCLAPEPDFIRFMPFPETYWKVNRQ